MPLSQVPVGSQVRIEQLPEGFGLREPLLALGIYAGVRLELVRRGRPGGLLHLAHGNQEFMLRQHQAAGIGVSMAQP
jgi:ferrous iron transport protein A